MLPIFISFFCLITDIDSLDLEQVKRIRELTGTAAGGVYRTCNFVFVPELTNVEGAREGCKDWGGNLVTIDSKSTNEDMKDLLDLAYPPNEQPESRWALTKWAWTGLTKTKNTIGKVKNGNFKPSEWSWSDGSSPVQGDFLNWMRKQPDQRLWNFGEQGCENKNGCYQTHLRFNSSGVWDDEAVHFKHPYACDYKGKYIVSKKKLEWIEAKVACENAGLVLAKIRNTKEVAELKNLMIEFYDKYDTNSHKFADKNWIWTGGNDLNDEGKFEWIDGEEIKFDIPWILKAGNDNAHTGQHALTMNFDGVFDDSFTEGKKRGFVCQCPNS